MITTIITAALTAIVIEMVIKPYSEARKDRHVERARNRRALAAWCNVMVTATWEDSTGEAASGHSSDNLSKRWDELLTIDAQAGSLYSQGEPIEQPLMRFTRELIFSERRPSDNLMKYYKRIAEFHQLPRWRFRAKQRTRDEVLQLVKDLDADPGAW